MGAIETVGYLTQAEDYLEGAAGNLDGGFEEMTLPGHLLYLQLCLDNATAAAAQAEGSDEDLGECRQAQDGLAWALTHLILAADGEDAAAISECQAITAGAQEDVEQAIALLAEVDSARQEVAALIADAKEKTEALIGLVHRVGALSEEACGKATQAGRQAEEIRNRISAAVA